MPKIGWVRFWKSRPIDGSIKNLGGYTVISSTTGTGREGVDERVFRFGLRFSF